VRGKGEQDEDWRSVEEETTEKTNEQDKKERTIENEEGSQRVSERRGKVLNKCRNRENVKEEEFGRKK
jgi:hypothetical protein